MKKLLNISNHSSKNWSDAQKAGWAEIIDIQFPNVPSTANFEQVNNMACQICEQIGKFLNENPNSKVMLQGEFTLCAIVFASVSDFPFIFPTTERKVIETVNADGTTTKTAVFEFVQWR